MTASSAHDQRHPPLCTPPFGGCLFGQMLASHVAAIERAEKAIGTDDRAVARRRGTEPRDLGQVLVARRLHHESTGDGLIVAAAQALLDRARACAFSEALPELGADSNALFDQIRRCRPQAGGGRFYRRGIGPAHGERESSPQHADAPNLTAGGAVDVAEELLAHDLGGPGRRIVGALEIGRRHEYVGRVQLVVGEEARTGAADRLVAPAEAEARHADTLRQMLVAIPVLVFRLARAVAIVP